MAAVRLSLILAVAFLGCSGQKAAKSGPEPNPSSSAKITQFYSSTPVIAKGKTGLLCYGVEGAAAVRIEPAVEQLRPAVTRCFEVRPTQTTTYTLIAEDRSGAAVKQTTEVVVGSAAPVLTDTFVNKAAISAGEEITVCWTARNATTVRAGPGKYMKGGVPSKDCIVDRPAKTTTYTVAVLNKEGLQDEASVTVQVK